MTIKINGLLYSVCHINFLDEKTVFVTYASDGFDNFIQLTYEQFLEQCSIALIAEYTGAA